MILTNDPAKVITVTIGGKTFRAGQRTVAHLLWTIIVLARLFPKAQLEVIQGCFNTGVAASAGTHDFDGCVDIRIVGLDWWAAQKFVRGLGWAAWFRHTGEWADPSRWHIHMCSIGCPGKVGVFVDGGLSQFGRITSSSQLDDYRRHALGLAGQHDSGDDSSWFPPDIDKTVFDFRQYLIYQEDHMPYTDWPAADRQALIGDLVTAIGKDDTVADHFADVLLKKLVDDDPATTVKAALRQGAQRK